MVLINPASTTVKNHLTAEINSTSRHVKEKHTLSAFHTSPINDLSQLMSTNLDSRDKTTLLFARPIPASIMIDTIRAWIGEYKRTFSYCITRGINTFTMHIQPLGDVDIATGIEKDNNGIHNISSPCACITIKRKDQHTFKSSYSIYDFCVADITPCARHAHKGDKVNPFAWVLATDREPMESNKRFVEMPYIKRMELALAGANVDMNTANDMLIAHANSNTNNITYNIAQRGISVNYNNQTMSLDRWLKAVPQDAQGFLIAIADKAVKEKLSLREKSVLSKKLIKHLN